jgi:RimJ/RimL family protein N-acetyltransferase
MTHIGHPVPLLPRETERMVLRRPSPDYAVVIQQAIEETFESLHRWMPWAKNPQSLQQIRDFLADAERRFVDGEDFVVSAFLKESDQFVLNTGIHPRNWAVPKFEIGFWCRSAMQGRGYVTEAVKELTKIAFREMAAKRVEIRCDTRNVASRRVAERSGFRLEAELKSDDRANDGSLRDTTVYIMLAEESDPEV